MVTCSPFVRQDIERFFLEDQLQVNLSYLESLPKHQVACELKLKSPMILSGLPYFVAVFEHLLDKKLDIDYDELEGKFFEPNPSVLKFNLPFWVALSGERLALNLLQHSSSISTYTNEFVKKASKHNIKILDTRKTTPGLRSLEKYAVKKGGGHNHRFSQTDVWMIKDNHKTFFGGIEKAIDYFRNIGSFYQNLVVEIHDLDELNLAIKKNISHVMLDNFSKDMIEQAIKIKPERMTYEVSGGIRLETLDQYLISGVDALSIGHITYGAPHVDISLKYRRC